MTEPTAIEIRELPAPLVARAPIVALGGWCCDGECGEFDAHVPGTGVWCTSGSPEGAARALAEGLHEFYTGVAPLAREGKLSGVLAQEWAAFCALVVVPE